MELETITIQIETKLYEEAKEVFEKEGYTIEEAFLLFIKASVACGGFPFPVTKEELLQAQGG